MRSTWGDSRRSACCVRNLTYLDAWKQIVSRERRYFCNLELYSCWSKRLPQRRARPCRQSKVRNTTAPLVYTEWSEKFLNFVLQHIQRIATIQLEVFTFKTSLSHGKGCSFICSPFDFTIIKLNFILVRWTHPCRSHGSCCWIWRSLPAATDAERFDENGRSDKEHA